jgi:hypothetical protein
MKMKMVMIAALVAAQLSAVAGPAQAAELPRDESATPRTMEQTDPADGRSGASLKDGVQLSLADVQAPAPRVDNAPAQAQDAEADKPRKRKSTGDKVLTGAAVILGIGALAVGALLVAIAVN